MKIYTKNGDKGSTQLFGDSQKHLKSYPVFACLGALDEINAHLGKTRLNLWAFSSDRETKKFLLEAQNWLLAIGAAVAGKKDSYTIHHLEEWVLSLESHIDELNKSLPELKCFIILGGSPTAADIHIARAVVRRGEREMVYQCLTSKVGWSAVPFLNRLSDFLFVLARYVNYRCKVKDEEWKSIS